mgnify:CR=1 FL=1
MSLHNTYTNMDRFLFQDVADVRERIQLLRDNADATEDLGYTKNIPGPVLDQLKDQLVENNIQLRDVRADKKAANKEFNEQIKHLEEQGDEMTGKLKSRTEYVTESCYKFVEDDQVGYYNNEGVLVFSRPARPDERQPRLFDKADFHGDNPYKRTGTDD